MKTPAVALGLFSICLIGALSRNAEAQILRWGPRLSRIPANRYVTPPSKIPHIEQTAPTKSPSGRKGLVKDAYRYELKSYSGKRASTKHAYQTKLRHVYRPIKDGPTKPGANGTTLILAEYIGTHLRSESEKSLGDMQDLQHGSVAQNIVSTAKDVKMWKEPYLDGTLRYIPLIPKRPNPQPILELLKSKSE